eukprot:TRINITY_DN53603_c0_g1_i1.p1 TRINITY_DN53603_c0_g1~~TRINITY_DN53603_c0_g1_i1.p1  ORF type:complete len:194 (+),score=27.09 TRINITY_DN53603_c0_g1_i1:132-713(+)
MEVGFRSSIVDVGITLYRGKPGPARTMHFGGPVIKADRLVRVIKNIFCPFIDLQQALKKIDLKKCGAVTSSATFTASFAGVVLYYVGWLLVFLDFIPIPEGGHVTLGVWNGTYNIIEQPVSNRYGHFRAYTNDWEAGSVATKSEVFWPEYKDAGITSSTMLRCSITVGSNKISPSKGYVFSQDASGWMSAGLY